MDFPNFQVWIKLNTEEFRVLNYETKEISSVNKLAQGINSFYVPKSYITKNDDVDIILQEYAEQLIKDRNELMNCKSLKIKYDYFNNTYKIGDEVKVFHRTHTNSVTTLFKMLSVKGKEIYSKFEDINNTEHKWSKLCNNGGLMYLKEKGDYECYGYDFKMFYPSILASQEFLIPSKQGKEKTINVLPKHLQFGYYRVSITSNDESFNKLFSFSKHNVYTNECLKFAREMSSKYSVTIKLFTDGKPNAYVYERECLVSGDKIFGNWYKRLVDMKTEMPKNKIIKLLSSSLWGHLSELNTIYKTEDEALRDNLKIGMTNKDNVDYIIENMIETNNYTYYELLDKSKPIYKYQLRLKSFITGYGRIRMARLIEENNLNTNVIRIQTDGLILDKPFINSIPNFMNDEKTSGNIHFYNVNKYNKV